MQSDSFSVRTPVLLNHLTYYLHPQIYGEGKCLAKAPIPLVRMTDEITVLKNISVYFLSIQLSTS